MEWGTGDERKPVRLRVSPALALPSVPLSKRGYRLKHHCRYVPPFLDDGEVRYLELAAAMDHTSATAGLCGRSHLAPSGARDGRGRHRALA